MQQRGEGKRGEIVCWTGKRNFASEKKRKKERSRDMEKRRRMAEARVCANISPPPLHCHKQKNFSLLLPIRARMGKTKGFLFFLGRMGKRRACGGIYFAGILFFWIREKEPPFPPFFTASHPSHLPSPRNIFFFCASAISHPWRNKKEAGENKMDDLRVSVTEKTEPNSHGGGGSNRFCLCGKNRPIVSSLCQMRKRVRKMRQIGGAICFGGRENFPKTQTQNIAS